MQLIYQDHWPVPQGDIGWITFAAQQQVAASIAPILATTSYRRRAADEIDVRNVPQPLFGWAASAAQAYIAPILSLPNFRTREGVALDVRNVQQPEFGWISHAADQGIAARIVPTFGKSSYRTPEGPTVDVRSIPQPLWRPTGTLGWRTTAILAEIVIRPHQPTGTVLQPPPMVFNTSDVLVQFTGPALPMEICSGYVGQPPVLTQLQQVRANYTSMLAPRSSQLHPVHVPQIGRPEKKGIPGVLSVKNSWFHLRQTDRYHRVCLTCTGDAEVTALTWMLREAGIK